MDVQSPQTGLSEVCSQTKSGISSFQCHDISSQVHGLGNSQLVGWPKCFRIWLESSNEADPSSYINSSIAGGIMDTAVSGDTNLPGNGTDLVVSSAVPTEASVHPHTTSPEEMLLLHHLDRGTQSFPNRNPTHTIHPFVWPVVAWSMDTMQWCWTSRITIC